MALARPANSCLILALLGTLCLTAADLRAQPRNPLRGAALIPAYDSLSELPSQDAPIWLVSDEDDPAPLAPPMNPVPTREFVLPHDQPPVWPDHPFPTQRQPAPDRVGAITLPSEEPDFGMLEDNFVTPLHPRRNHRFTGWGQPLHSTSWLNRPWYFGGYIGQAFLGDVVPGVQQHNAALVGWRLGWDFDYYWGFEGRFGYSNPNLTPLAPNVIDGMGHDYFVDFNVMWYPTGDSRWRPYLSAGLGAATYRFELNGGPLHDTGLGIPLGVGLKYFLTPWSSLRMEFQYAPSFGTERLSTMHNLAIGLSAEIRFGGTRRSYFPWTSNTAYW